MCEGIREYEVSVYGVMHGMSMHFLHVCVCVLTEFWSFCTLKAADVMMSERQRERAQTSKLTKQDTLHTHQSLNMLTEQCECCVYLYVRLRVCVLHVSGWPYCCVFLVAVEIMLLQVIFHLS